MCICILCMYTSGCNDFFCSKSKTKIKNFSKSQKRKPKGKNRRKSKLKIFYILVHIRNKIFPEARVLPKFRCPLKQLVSGGKHSEPGTEIQVPHFSMDDLMGQTMFMCYICKLTFYPAFLFIQHSVLWRCSAWRSIFTQKNISLIVEG